MIQYQKGNINLDFTEARDSEWKWQQLGRMQVYTSLQTDNQAMQHPTTQFLQVGCHSCRPTNSVRPAVTPVKSTAPLKAIVNDRPNRLHDFSIIQFSTSQPFGFLHTVDTLSYSASVSSAF